MRERSTQPRRDDSEGGSDHGGTADFVGVHLLGGEQIEHGRSVRETQVREQRSRIGVGRSCVDGRERVVEASEHEVVDSGEEQEGVVPAGRCLGDEVEHIVARGDRTADAVIRR